MKWPSAEQMPSNTAVTNTAIQTHCTGFPSASRGRALLPRPVSVYIVAMAEVGNPKSTQTISFGDPPPLLGWKPRLRRMPLSYVPSPHFVVPAAYSLL